jgi:hypothetical protein
MTEEQMAEAIRHMAESREKFVEGLRLTMDVMMALNERIRTFQNFLDAQQSLFDSRFGFAQTVQDSIEAVAAAFAESSTATRENSERLDKVISKLEAYFGSSDGLEYDN